MAFKDHIHPHTTTRYSFIHSVSHPPAEMRTLTLYHHPHLQHIAWLRMHEWAAPESSSLALCDKQANVGIAAVVVIGENTALSVRMQTNSTDALIWLIL